MDWFIICSYLDSVLVERVLVNVFGCKLWVVTGRIRLHQKLA